MPLLLRNTTFVIIVTIVSELVSEPTAYEEDMSG